MMTARFGEPLSVAVLAGADSAEREVSLRSGAAVAEALTTAGHRVVLIDPATTPLADVDWKSIDVCFIALHGGAGEDGRVQRALEKLHVSYTGSGPEASRIAMVKSLGKQCFSAHGVPTAPFELLEPTLSDADAKARVAWLGYPLIIKPDSEGSSVGLSLVRTADELPPALATARQFGPCLAEKYIAGREFTVAVLDDKALPLLEIVAADHVFSYEAKYVSKQTQYRFDFELAADKQQQIRSAAVAATSALGTAGLVRVDVMLGEDGFVWVLEVNTIPGMTARSLAPQAAQRDGLEMPELCDLLVRRALTTAGAK